ncbi:Phosphoglycerate mutase family protein [Striga hermonthica]|uniref:Phosphoglycerate mutase family protein n=1 Tax=Striga hermonthica TaxID=68872 RepID=A0A9N7NU34_STRHE|nr:Phosphoglycerate mutase family protein [Striga hermonthica]
MGSGYANGSFVKNRYWILRHGKSIPNEKGLIVSSLENGILEEYQLASDGVRQARLAGESFLRAYQFVMQHLKENEIDLNNVRICYSPFSRTKHTAKEVASVLNIPFEGPQCKVVQDIRERFFGSSFELQSHDKYPEIWALDENDPFMQPKGGESVADVVTRLTRALAMMESEFEKCTILVVSHGDPLQIMQTILNATREHGNSTENELISIIDAIRVPSVLSQHRKFALNTGELRQLI